MIGTVLHYNQDRGFGFIARDGGGADVFVHARDLLNADELRADQRVSFEIATDHRHTKPRADQVRVL